MKTKILIGSIAAVVAVGATIGIILGVVSKNKKNRRVDPEETRYSEQDTSRDYADDPVWTETSDTESEATETSQQITEDSIFVKMDDMTADECADNLWKTSKVYVGMTKEEYFKKIIIPKEFSSSTDDDSFSWSFNGIGSGSKRHISVLQVFSAGDCSPVFDDYGNLSLVRIQMDIESEEFGNELIDKLIEKFTAEGYTLVSDDTNYDMRVARFQGHGKSVAITRSYLGNRHFIGFDIPIISG